MFFACVSVFMCLAIINFLDFVKKVQENTYIEWDLKTITSGDYTVEFALHPDFFKTFLEKEFMAQARKFRNRNNREYVSRVEAFRDWIQNEME